MKRIGKFGLMLAVFSCLALTSCGKTNRDRADQIAAEQDGSDDFSSSSSAQTSVNTKLKLKPANPTNSPSAVFKFVCTAAPCTYKCKLDSLGWTKCKSPKTYLTLADGLHNFQVKAAKNGVTDRTPAKWSWTIDTAAPDTTINSYPTDPTNQTDPQFTFSANESGCTFECQLDSAGFTACSSPKDYIGMGEGPHNFSVRATDAAGNPDSSPAVQEWTVDLTRPNTNILSNPPDPDHSTFPAFTFSSNEAGSTFECRWDSSAWASCASPAEPPWQPTTMTNAPSARYKTAAVWNGTEVIFWGGYDGTNYFNTGFRYDPVGDAWTPIATANAPEGRYDHTGVWTGQEMIVWGGYNGSNFPDTGGKYDPGANSWNALATVNAPPGRKLHTAVWTGGEMIVWGGGDGSNFFNTGGRYDPEYDSWLSLTIVNAPDTRWGHSGIWTGTEMIVWGGDHYDGSHHYLNTGGGYNPQSDSWNAVSTVNAPSARNYPAAVWTGSEMIAWGGISISASYLNTGGRYSPGDDSWIATTTANAPPGRYWHQAVWASHEMIIYGGYNGAIVTDAGYRYSPDSDLWIPLTTLNAPEPRDQHAMVWTGSELLIWGGIYSGFLDTGGRLGMLDGHHTFEVRATDTAGNIDLTPASYAWTVDATPPQTTITSQPASPSHASSATFEFSCNEASCTFECQLDSGGYSACASPKNYDALANGAHSFQVRATDLAANTDATPAGYDWTIVLANAVSAGGWHSCALLSNRDVLCWGQNAYGQLGDGTTVAYSKLPVMASLSGTAQITAGSQHTCAKSFTGEVRCWGYNNYGQLGVGDTTFIASNQPLPISGMYAIDISAGANHACVVNSGFAAQCWGANSYGVLGDGTTANYRKSPVAVSGLSSGQSRISSGTYHSCALSSTGGVKCWGGNIYGALGDGTTVNSNVPVQVSGLTSGVESISAGGYHTCAKMSTGGVKCWGWNTSGQLGDGSTAEFRKTPVSVSGLSSGVLAISTGENHTCASTASGNLIKCWGYNSHGRLGDGTFDDHNTPTDVLGISTGLYSLSAGMSHTCVAIIGGPVKCWGYNNYGQLGDGSTADRTVPTDVSGFGP